MTSDTIIDILQALFLLAGGALISVLREAIKDQKVALETLERKVDEHDTIIERKLSDMRVELARDYMPRHELTRAFEEIKHGILRIEEKMDSKADKRL